MTTEWSFTLSGGGPDLGFDSTPDTSFSVDRDFNIDTSLNLSDFQAPSTYQAPSDFEAPTTYRDTGGATTPVTTFDLAPSLRLPSTVDLTPDLSLGVPDLLGAAAGMAAPTVEAAPETTWSPGELAFLDETSAMLAEDLGKVGELTQSTFEIATSPEGAMSLPEAIVKNAGVYTLNEQGQVVSTATFMSEAPQEVSGPLIDGVVRARDAVAPSGMTIAEEVSSGLKQASSSRFWSNFFFGTDLREAGVVTAGGIPQQYSDRLAQAGTTALRYTDKLATLLYGGESAALLRLSRNKSPEVVESFLTLPEGVGLGSWFLAGAASLPIAGAAAKAQAFTEISNVGLGALSYLVKGRTGDFQIEYPEYAKPGPMATAVFETVYGLIGDKPPEVAQAPTTPKPLFEDIFGRSEFTSADGLSETDIAQRDAVVLSVGAYQEAVNSFGPTDDKVKPFENEVRNALTAAYSDDIPGFASLTEDSELARTRPEMYRFASSQKDKAINLMVEKGSNHPDTQKAIRDFEVFSSFVKPQEVTTPPVEKTIDQLRADAASIRQVRDSVVGEEGSLEYLMSGNEPIAEANYRIFEKQMKDSGITAYPVREVFDRHQKSNGERYLLSTKLPEFVANLSSSVDTLETARSEADLFLQDYDNLSVGTKQKVYNAIEAQANTNQGKAWLTRNNLGGPDFAERLKNMSIDELNRLETSLVGDPNLTEGAKKYIDGVIGQKINDYRYSSDPNQVKNIQNMLRNSINFPPGYETNKQVQARYRAMLDDQLATLSKKRSDFDTVKLKIQSDFSSFNQQLLAMQANPRVGWSGTFDAVTGERKSHNVGNYMMAISAGLGAIQALYLGPKNQKDYLEWQEKQAEKNREWQKEMYQMQRGGGGGGSGPGRGTPSAAAAVSF